MCASVQGLGWQKLTSVVVYFTMSMQIDNGFHNSTCVHVHIMHCNENESEKKWNDEVKHVHTTFAFYIRSYNLFRFICTVLHAAICCATVHMQWI